MSIAPRRQGKVKKIVVKKVFNVERPKTIHM
jgi:hypothetical protein